MPTVPTISRRRRAWLLLGACVCWALLVPALAPPTPLPSTTTPAPETNRFPEQHMVSPESLKDGQSLYDKYFIMRILDMYERQTLAKHGQPPLRQFSRDYIFEGDIVLERSQALGLLVSQSAHARWKRKADVNALRPTSDHASKRWDLPINYIFRGNFPDAHQAAVREGVATWEKNTCIRFTHDPSSSAKSIVFLNDHMCYSYVGRNTNGKQQIVSVGDTCLRQGHVVHELGHALGFWHEHARNDRNEHVRVLWDNIRMGQSHNFVNKSWSVINNLAVPYDVGSVMHYSGKTFAVEGSLATLESVDPRLQFTMGQRRQLSFYDAKLANIAYCNTSCDGIPLTGSCLYDGYQDPNNCSRCRCPDGLSGDFCETVAPSIGECGGIVNLTVDGTVTIASPGYPSSYVKGLQCYWLVKSPNGTSIRLEFEAPYMHSGFCDAAHPYQQCEDFVEVRAGDNIALTGGRFCCDDDVQAAMMKLPILSNSSHALVLFHSYEGGRVGFKLRLSVESCGGCHSTSQATQKPCSRSVVRDCVQTWYVKERLNSCAVPYWGCETQYRTKAVHRNTKCYSEEPYCCHGFNMSQVNTCTKEYEPSTTEATTIVTTRISTSTNGHISPSPSLLMSASTSTTSALAPVLLPSSSLHSLLSSSTFSPSLLSTSTLQSILTPSFSSISIISSSKTITVASSSSSLSSSSTTPTSNLLSSSTSLSSNRSSSLVSSSSPIPSSSSSLLPSSIPSSTMTTTSSSSSSSLSTTSTKTSLSTSASSSTTPASSSPQSSSSQSSSSSITTTTTTTSSSFSSSSTTTNSTTSTSSHTSTSAASQPPLSVPYHTTDESEDGNSLTWSAWTNWSACSVTCGGCGTRRRTRSRSCYADEQCERESSEPQACGSAPCGRGMARKTCGETTVQAFGCGLFSMYTCYRQVTRYTSQTFYCCCGFSVDGENCTRTTR